MSSIVSFSTYRPLNVLKTLRANSARLSIRCKPNGNRKVPVRQMSKPIIICENNSIQDARRSSSAKKDNATSDDSPAEVRIKYIMTTT